MKDVVIKRNNKKSTRWVSEVGRLDAMHSSCLES